MQSTIKNLLLHVSDLRKPHSRSFKGSEALPLDTPLQLHLHRARTRRLIVFVAPHTVAVKSVFPILLLLQVCVVCVRDCVSEPVIDAIGSRFRSRCGGGAMQHALYFPCNLLVVELRVLRRCGCGLVLV